MPFTRRIENATFTSGFTFTWIFGLTSTLTTGATFVTGLTGPDLATGATGSAVRFGGRYRSSFSRGTRRGLCQRQRKVCNDLAILRNLSNQFERRIGRHRERDITGERVEPVTARGRQWPGHRQISTDGFRVDLFVCHVREHDVATRGNYFKLVVRLHWLKVGGFNGSSRRTYVDSSTRVFQADVSGRGCPFRSTGKLFGLQYRRSAFRRKQRRLRQY